jgi:hypothetical protein
VRGIGRALIDDLLQRCRRDGWSRLYWHIRARTVKRGGFTTNLPKLTIRLLLD